MTKPMVEQGVTVFWGQSFLIPSSPQGFQGQEQKQGHLYINEKTRQSLSAPPLFCTSLGPYSQNLGYVFLAA